jgi:ribonuclease J
MVSLTFYGGVNEIGGNKILLKDGDTKIFLDFGMSFSKANQFFSEFLQPRKCNVIGDLIEFGLLPDLKGFSKAYGKGVRGKAICPRNIFIPCTR